MKILRHSPGVLRSAVFRRDRGVCAGCGFDCHAVECFLDEWYAHLLDTAPIFDRGMRPAWANAQMALLRLQAGMPLTGSLWQADHIVPFELGGADDLGNVQTLCWECHQSKTREDVRLIRKAKRIQAKAPRKHFGFGG